jgi:WWE domain/NAD:arginine ADP-ribosyltransferase
MWILSERKVVTKEVASMTPLDVKFKDGSSVRRAVVWKRNEAASVYATAKASNLGLHTPVRLWDIKTQSPRDGRVSGFEGPNLEVTYESGQPNRSLLSLTKVTQLMQECIKHDMKGEAHIVDESLKDVDEVEKLFAKLDTNNAGTLTPQDIAVGLGWTPEAVQKLMIEFDDNNDGVIDLGEFKQIVAKAGDFDGDAKVPKWFWQGDAKWEPFDDDTTKMLETNFNKSNNVFDLTHGFFGKSGGYRIDLDKMTQVRKSTNFIRPIKREAPSILAAVTSDVLSMMSIMSRVADVGTEDGGLRGPLNGMFPSTLPIPTLADSLKPVQDVLPNIRHSYHRAWKKAKALASKYPTLTVDEIGAIYLYTLEVSPHSQSPYNVMNAALRAQDRGAVKPFRMYIWLLMNSIKKLPPMPSGLLYRGVKKPLKDFGDQYKTNGVIQWSGFSSTAVKVNVMNQFLGQKGPRTLFNIFLSAGDARNIAPFSKYPNEAEALLPPNSAFKIIGIMDGGNGLQIVQLQQTDSLDPLIDMH